MSRKHNNLTSLFQDIANAIYAKNGYDVDSDSGDFIADNFPEAIATIDTDPSGDATLNSGNQMLEGVTAYSQGTKYTGTIVTQSASGNTTLDQSTTSTSYAAGYYPNAHGANIVLESPSTVNPTEEQQVVSPATGKLLDTVTVNAIPSDYVGSAIPQNDGDDVTVSGPTVSIPNGYYSSDVSKSVITTTHPDPVITTSYNSANNKLQITATHTQGTGYVTGNTTTDVTNINGGSVTKSGDTVTTSAGYYDTDVTTTVDSATLATPSISAVHANNKLTVTATQIQGTSGWVTAGSTSATYDIDDGVISTSGNTVTVGSGYYDEDEDITIAAGSATTPTDSITSNPSISWNNTTKKIEASHSGSKSITPTVVAGYVSSGTAGTISTSGSDEVTAESLDANLAAANVKSGTTIFNTTGTFSASNTITGTGKTAASASDILTGKSAFLNGSQINGTMVNNGATGSTLTTNGSSYTIPAGYTSGGTVGVAIPVDTLTNSIIDGAAFEESDGDFGWQSTVQIPAGMHAGQTLTKTFSDVFPAPASEGTSDDILLGQQFYDHSGHLITGTMPNNGADSHVINTQGGSYTIPEGYHNGEGVITATLPTTSRSAGSGSVTLTKGAGSVSATGTNITITESATQPSSGYYITAQGNGTVSGVGKGIVSTGTGYITSGSTTSNEANATETSNTATKYYTVAGSSVTSGQALPSGSSASGTAGYGTYAKVSAGYYPSDRYIGSGVSAGSATTPATTVSSTVDSVSFAYNSDNGNFDVTGSGSATKSVTPTVSAGYVSSGTAGTITGSASVSATALKIGGSVSISGTKMYTPAISRTTKPSGDTWTDAASGAATTTKPTSGPYVQVNTAKASGNVSAGATISTAGYGTSSNHGISGSGNVEVGANASSNTYVPITTTSASVSGPTVSYGSGWITAGSKTVASGSATTPATSVTAGNASSSSVASSTGIVTITTAQATKSVTPTVSAGYITAGTAGTITVPSKTYTYQLPTTKGATTYTPSTSNQTIAAGTYLTGIQTISGDADLTAANIKKGVDIFGVTGTYTSDATATASDIASGKTAYVNGSKLTGTGTMASGDATVVDYDEGFAAAAYLSGKSSVAESSGVYTLTSVGTVTTVDGKLVLNLADAC